MPRGVPNKNTMWVCTTTFVSEHGDANQGERFADGHDTVKANPQYFERVELPAREIVESATAAPGETRDKPAATPKAKAEPKVEPEPEPVATRVSESPTGITTQSFKKP